MEKPILTRHEVIKIFLFDLVGSMLLGVSVVTFAVNAEFAPGGVSGLAVILNFIFDLPIGWMTVLINVPIILCTFRKLGLRFFIMSMKSMLLGSLIIDYVMPLFPAYEGSRLLASIFAGVCAGVGYSLIFNEDSSTGGTDFIIVAIKRAKPKLSFGLLALVIDGSIIVLSVFIYRNIGAFFYGMIYTVITSAALDLTTKVINRYFPKWKATSV